MPNGQSPMRAARVRRSTTLPSSSVTGRIVARTNGGHDLDAPFAHVFTVLDGKIARNDLFNDTALWVAALA